MKMHVKMKELDPMGGGGVFARNAPPRSASELYLIHI